MTDETGYQGWTNYETWAVKLWMDNDAGSYEYWRETTQSVVAECGDKSPNEFADKAQNERIMLAALLKDAHEEGAEQFMGDQSSVYADLMNAALGSVNWHEIADSLLETHREEQAA
jgi:hypothetical protein